jgi:hypothetical protein
MKLSCFGDKAGALPFIWIESNQAIYKELTRAKGLKRHAKVAAEKARGLVNDGTANYCRCITK